MQSCVRWLNLACLFSIVGGRHVLADAMLADAGTIVRANLGWVVEPSCVLGERAQKIYSDMMAIYSARAIRWR